MGFPNLYTLIGSEVITRAFQSEVRCDSEFFELFSAPRFEMLKTHEVINDSKNWKVFGLWGEVRKA